MQIQVTLSQNKNLLPATTQHKGQRVFILMREREREMFYLTTHSTHFILRLYGVRHMVKDHSDSERERNVLSNDAFNTFYLRLYGIRHMVKDHSDSEREREMFYLTTHSTHFIYGYMASYIWLRTILIMRKETRCRHIGYSYRLTQQGFFYMHHPTDRITHTMAFVTPVVKHWLILMTHSTH